MPDPSTKPDRTDGLAQVAVTLALSFVVIYLPLEMQNIVRPFNEACFGPLSDARISEILRIRAWTWAGSFIGVGLAICALLILHKSRHRARFWRLWLLGTFVVWKASALIYDAFGSPVCWEPYADGAPIWDEPAIAGLAFLLQPLGYVALVGVVCALSLVTLGRVIIELKTPTKRGN